MVKTPAKAASLFEDNDVEMEDASEHESNKTPPMKKAMRKAKAKAKQKRRRRNNGPNGLFFLLSNLSNTVITVIQV